MKIHTAAACGIVLLLSLAACTSTPMTPASSASLYDRLGGKPAITAVVDDFIGTVAADAVINRRFAGANISRLKMMLVARSAPLPVAHAPIPARTWPPRTKA